MSGMEPTVYVVDDDEAMRDSLRFLIESVCLPVQCYASAQEFLDYYQPNMPGCMLLDVRLPRISGLDLHERMVAQNMLLPVIILTGHGDISMAVRAMKKGAFDFIEKPFNDQLLLERVQQAIEHDSSIRREQAEKREVEARLAHLTLREREIMAKLVEGKPNKSIARELDISYKTVEAHRGKVMEKMQADNLAELVRMAMLCELFQNQDENSSSF